MIDLTKFRFSVIYSIDVPSRPARDEDLESLTPPDYGKRGWECTERGPSECNYGKGWRPGRHRKHVNVLTFEQFCDFIEYVGLFVEKCQTLGSLGAPGCGGLSPAVPFQSDAIASIQRCFVTPIPPDSLFPDPDQLPLPGMEIPMPQFETVEQEMWEWFTDGAYSARKEAESVGIPEQVFD